MSIFICHRRGLTPGAVETIYTKLESRLGSRNVFADFGTLLPGQRFEDETSKRLLTSSLVLVVIGEGWEEHLSTRAQVDVQDFVRDELDMARSASIPVVPILIDRPEKPLDATKLPKTLHYLLGLDPEHLRTSQLLPDFDSLIRRLSLSYPRIFGHSLAPPVLSDEIMRELNNIPIFSGMATRPATDVDTWTQTEEFLFSGPASDDFRFSVVEGNRRPNIFFLNGYDNTTAVSLASAGGKSPYERRIDGIRSQYGFFWPEHYYTICGEYGARDYFYNPPLLGSSRFSVVLESIFNWVFMKSEQVDEERGALSGYAMGCARRGNSDGDVVLFSTVEHQPVKYFRSFNGLYDSNDTKDEAFGTHVQFSQVAGGYRDFAFALKDVGRGRHNGNNRYKHYYGLVDDRTVSVRSVEVAQYQELFVLPSGVPLKLSTGGSGSAVFDILSREDPSTVLETIEFEGIGGEFYADVSFSRDGRTIAFAQPWRKKILLLDLFSASLIAEIPEHLEPIFSPDGERLVATNVGSKRVVSIFSRSGEHKKVLGPVSHKRSIQFRYDNNNHYDVHPVVVWGDSGRRVFVLNDQSVSQFDLGD